MQNVMWSVLSTKVDDKTSGSVGAKVYKEFTEAIKYIGTVKSVEVLPNHDENSGLVTKCDGHVGVQLQAVPLMFMHAYKNMMDGTHKDVENLTRCIVLCCPDCTTAWNIRKEILSEDVNLHLHEQEHVLTSLVLNLHPKSSETFAHRRWICKILSRQIIVEILELLKNETTGAAPIPPRCENLAQSSETNPKSSSDQPDPIPAHKIHNLQAADNTESLDRTLCRASSMPDHRPVKSTLQCGKFSDNFGAESNKTDISLLETFAASAVGKIRVNHTLSYQHLGVEGRKCKVKLGELLDLVRCEFSVCELAGEKQKSNYNAWAHRCWVVSGVIVQLRKDIDELSQSPMSADTMIAKEHDDASRSQKAVKNLKIGEDSSEICAQGQPNLILAVQNELERFMRKDVTFMTEFTRKHVSDISILNAFLHSLKCWTEMTHLSDERFSVWVQSLHHSAELLELYDVHEALWCHRRNLVITFQKIFAKNESDFSAESEIIFCRKLASLRRNDAEFLIAIERHMNFLHKFLTLA